MKTEQILEKIGANRGVIGIDGALAVFGCYDSREYDASITEPDWVTDEDDRKAWLASALTKKEKLGLADEMIRRWSAYRNAVDPSEDYDPLEYIEEEEI